MARRRVHGAARVRAYEARRLVPLPGRPCLVPPPRALLFVLQRRRALLVLRPVVLRRTDAPELEQAQALIWIGAAEQVRLGCGERGRVDPVAGEHVDEVGVAGGVVVVGDGWGRRGWGLGDDVGDEDYDMTAGMGMLDEVVEFGGGDEDNEAQGVWVDEDEDEGVQVRDLLGLK